jgi:hypothetical protein
LGQGAQRGNSNQSFPPAENRDGWTPKVEEARAMRAWRQSVYDELRKNRNDGRFERTGRRKISSSLKERHLVEKVPFHQNKTPEKSRKTFVRIFRLKKTR